MGENLCLLLTSKGLIFGIYRELKRLSPQRINTQWRNGKSIKQGILKGSGTNGQ
jgi:hypothetical protein